MPTKPKPVDEQLRAAIALAERRGMTRYAIAKAAGMAESQIHRIADAVTVPRLDTADRIAAAIGCKISVEPDR